MRDRCEDLENCRSGNRCLVFDRDNHLRCSNSSQHLPQATQIARGTTSEIGKDNIPPSPGLDFVSELPGDRVLGQNVIASHRLFLLVYNSSCSARRNECVMNISPSNAQALAATWLSAAAL